MAALAQDSNDDVDRAMATFTASGIPYRTFAGAVAAPAQAEHESNDATSTVSLAASTRTDAFPLLTAALPEVTQFPMPHQFVARNTAPAPPPTPAPRESEPSPNPETRPPALNQIDSSAVRRSPAVFNVPVRQTHEPRKLKPNITAPNASADRTTPLASVFHTLQVANPARQDRTAPHSQLQTILKRL
jgi:hypothetical protein